MRDFTAALHVPSILAYAGLTVAYTWPLALRLGESVPYDLGDPLLSTWTLWWNTRAIPFTTEWWNGPVFFPTQLTLALSDHRVGLGLITTPLILLGASPLTAYNVAFLLSFWLSAASAYALGFRLTGSRSAAFLGGLVFGFNPFRATHLAHLELLSSYWLPLILLGLHQWLQTQRFKWLGCAAVALFMQALTSGYNYFFFGVLLVLWLIWFVPRRLRWSQYAAVGLAIGVPLLVIAPVLFKYRQAHRAMGLYRSAGAIETFSADLAGLLATPTLLAVWHSPVTWQMPEGALFPGVMACALVLATLLFERRHPQKVGTSILRRVRAFCLVVAVGALLVAVTPGVVGPQQFDVGGTRFSVSAFYKPFSIAVLFFGCWVLTSDGIRRAWRSTSTLAFYALATVAMWVFALGPTGRFMGQRVLYKAPYAWLMLLPGFHDGFRAPARFGMIAALTLGVAAAIAFARLLDGRPRRVQMVAFGVAAAGIVADGWIDSLPLVQPPPPLFVPRSVPHDAVILELPIGTYEDGAAMFHAMVHKHPIANGLSGYMAPQHVLLSIMLDEGAVEVLSELARPADIAIFVTRDPRGAALGTLLRSKIPVQSLPGSDTHDIFLLSGSPLPKVTGRVTRVPVSRLAPESNPERIRFARDNDPRTAWVSAGAQRGGEHIVVDLGALVPVSGVVLSLGEYLPEYPRGIAVDLSTDGLSWTEVLSQSGAVAAYRAAMDTPRDVDMIFSFDPQHAQHVRIRQVGRAAQPWAVAELNILGSY